MLLAVSLTKFILERPIKRRCAAPILAIFVRIRRAEETLKRPTPHVISKRCHTIYENDGLRRASPQKIFFHDKCWQAAHAAYLK